MPVAVDVALPAVTLPTATDPAATWPAVMLVVSVGLLVALFGHALMGRLVSVHRPVPARRSASARGPSAVDVARLRPWRFPAGLAALYVPARRFAAALGDRRRRPPDDVDVARWCDALARSMRSGDTLVGAIRSSPVPDTMQPHLTPVVLALDRGAGAAVAVGAMRHRSPGLDAAVTVIAACATLGGPAAEPLDRVAVSLRRRVADTAERRAQSSQARLSAITLTVLPGAVLVVLIASSTTVRASVTGPAGTASVVAGITLNVIGWTWMRRVIGGAP